MAKPAQAQPASPGIAFPAGLEDSIKEMIKPLIVQWLNENLPRIVERAVREEIADQGLVSGRAAKAAPGTDRENRFSPRAHRPSGLTPVCARG